MAKEAYVKISEVLMDAPALASTETPFLVAGVIKSKYGNFDVNYFTSRADFLNMYTANGKLDGSCDITLVNAYEVLGSSPILVCRAAPTNKPQPLKIDSNPYFGIEFNDYLQDHRYKVSYLLQDNPEIPGSMKLNVTYAKADQMYSLSLNEDSYDGGISNGGSGYQIGDVVTLYPASSYYSDSIKVRILGLDTNRSMNNMRGGNLRDAPSPVNKVQLLTKVSQSSATSYGNATGGSGYGLGIEVNTNQMPAEEVKSYDVVFALDERVKDAEGNSVYYKNVFTDDMPFDVYLKSATPSEVTVPNPYQAIDPTQPDTLTYVDYWNNSPTTAGTYYATNSVNGSIPQYPLASDGSEDSNYAIIGNDGHWTAFEDYEDRQIPMFSDFGTDDGRVSTYLASLAEKFNSMFLVSIPRSSESLQGALAFGNSDLGNSRAYYATPYARSSHLGFMSVIAPTTQYLNTIRTNAAAGKEFEAVAGNKTGIVKYSDLTHHYTKSEREKLLDIKINTINYREVDGYAMFNDDLTSLIQNNPFKEEFNRRLGVRIAQDVDTLMQQFKFSLNTPSTRDTVQSVIANYFDTASFKHKISAYQVICNDKNNPPEIQAQNKLMVTVNIAFYFTAKYIEVVNNIYSVGQSFSE